jgi:hypothetical protein
MDYFFFFFFFSSFLDDTTGAIEYSELEKYTGRETSEIVYPVLAGASTGFLFKSTSGNPRIMAL